MIKTTKLCRNSLRYLSKANLPIGVNKLLQGTFEGVKGPKLRVESYRLTLTPNLTLTLPPYPYPLA